MPFFEVGRENEVTKVEPASIPLPIPDDSEHKALSMEMYNGSEDLIIHDSEEDEALSPGGVKADMALINLGRFVFVG